MQNLSKGKGKVILVLHYVPRHEDVPASLTTTP
jgi:hypothetical protein